ncbi:sulfotransferase family 2 domain-containing protein [Cyanobium sp. Morenito 9A2]|uniref:sulfotransferase family 2 domain-containing protein n=1 Tax=Cyanobium sp. Morenito 9A2 TaxID=2823718 RepID=UPI0020CEBA0C|nr:sulfotransferase family 2 domain-containing protein [Cyanobium sp. Morenito 9A2]MCP9849563.1 sulfotransferase family 2 domain-containing protein [Cyanobium sp. Morenito 9A2]
MTIFTSPKCSCRSVSDFAWEVAKQTETRNKEKINIIVFRNPYNRLISGYLNKYVEHTKYVEAARRKNPRIELHTFENFLHELSANGLRLIDKLHFTPQISAYKRRTFDLIFNSENLLPLERYINSMFLTSVEMPFRVNKFGAKNMDCPQSIETEASYASEIWKLNSAQLLELIKSKTIPGYKFFYNSSLKSIAEQFYRDDFNFLHECLKQGLMDTSFHKLMTCI